MKKSLFNSIKYAILGATIIGLVLPYMPAKADQNYVFSDDLYSTYNLDSGATQAIVSGGKASTADGSVSSAIQSDVVANSYTNIASARLDVADSQPSNTRIIYYLSNTGGYRWLQVNPGYTYTFDTVGGELSWKAVITRNSPYVMSASIDSVTITYTVSDLATNNYNSSSNYNYSGYNYQSSGNYSAPAVGTNDLLGLVCGALSSIGLGCGQPSQSTYVSHNYASTGLLFGSGSTQNSNTNSSSSSGSNLTATIYNGTVKDISGNDINLVRVKGQSDIYEIVNGMKHLIPTKEIFYDYGFTDDMIQDITQKQLDKYRRIWIIQPKDSKTDYYLTDGGMVRLIPNDTIFNSYGDRKEDVLVVSQKEFNFYPVNQFVFLENPLSRDVYQIVNNEYKRFITPMAVKRMNIPEYQIAPINQTQLDYYKIGAPIIK